MRRLLRRVRARRDYLVFLGAHEWPIVVAALGVLLGVVTLLPSPVGLVLSVIALILGVATLARDLRHLRVRWSAYEFTTSTAPFPADEIPPPAAYPAAEYVHVPGRGTMLVSDEMDGALRTRPYTVSLDPKPYRLPPELKATAPYVLPARAKGRLLFNGGVIGMHGEPLPAVAAGSSRLRLHRGTFFDGQCSNELFALRVVRRDTGEDFDLRGKAMVGPDGRLRTLAESDLADFVGVSTIAFTSDGLLVTVRQSAMNQASALLLAPSGSGSLEPRDLRPGVDSLTETMRAGMEREMCEETGLRPAEILSTTVTGFGRWMERGARPEYFGLSRLSVTADALSTRRVSSDENVYSAATSFLALDLAALGASLRAGTRLLDAPALSAQLRTEGSLPLLFAIRAAALWTVDEVGLGSGGDG